MAARRVPARDIIVQVSDGQPVPTWLTIAGVKNVTFNPSENEEEVDATEFASAGDYEGMIMQRGSSAAIEANMIKDHVTDAQDAGQARCEVIAAGKAYASHGAIRFRHPAATVWRVWNTATFSLGEQGGGNNDLTSWACTIKKSGASTTVAV